MQLNTRESGSFGSGLRSDREETPLPPLPSRPLIDDTKLLFGQRPASQVSRKRDRQKRDADKEEEAQTTSESGVAEDGSVSKPAAAEGVSQPLREVKCHRCLQIGHISRNCTARKEISVARCFKCGQTGHWARSCTKSGSLDAFGPRDHEVHFIRREHKGGEGDEGGRHSRGQRPTTEESLDNQLDAYMRARAAAEKQE